MPKTTKAKKKVSKPRPKVVSKLKSAVTKVVSKAPIKISKTYIPKDTEKYMCEKHKVFFALLTTLIFGLDTFFFALAVFDICKI